MLQPGPGATVPWWPSLTLPACDLPTSGECCSESRPNAGGSELGPPLPA